MPARALCITISDDRGDESFAAGIYGLDTQYHPTSNNATVASLAEQLALQDFTRKARQRLHSWQGGVFAGEFKEMVGLLASPTKRLRVETGNLLESLFVVKRKYLKADDLLELRKINPKKAAQIARGLKNAIADTWLEWSFGVKPTIQDCNDAATAFRRMAKGEHVESIRITGHGSADAYSRLWTAQDYGFGYSGLGAFAQGNVDQYDHCDAMVRAAWVSQAPSGDMPLPMTFGVDLSSIVPTAWELLPWSFLVDYFTSVGSAIDAWSIRLVDFSWCNRTVRNRRTVKLCDLKWEPLNSPFSFGSVWVNGPYIASMSRYEVNRTKGFPPVETAGFYLKVPGVASTKWLNIAALLNGISVLSKH
jgi:hypothetical protein